MENDMNNPYLKMPIERVLRDIEGRMQRRRQSGIVQAMKDFLAGKKQRSRKHREKKKIQQGKLW